MIRAVQFASVAIGVLAQIETGNPSCPCLGSLPEQIEDKACDYEWAYNGKCVEVTLSVGQQGAVMYPADYGETCKKHLEPYDESCFDQAKLPPVELPAKDQQFWCGNPWCYVDPSACNAADMTQSLYFPVPTYYSYATCGDPKEFSAIEFTQADQMAGPDTEIPEGGESGGIGSPECVAECPGVTDIMKELQEKLDAMDTMPTEYDLSWQMPVLCKHIDTVECVTKSQHCPLDTPGPTAEDCRTWSKDTPSPTAEGNSGSCDVINGRWRISSYVLHDGVEEGELHRAQIGLVADVKNGALVWDVDPSNTAYPITSKGDMCCMYEGTHDHGCVTLPLNSDDTLEWNFFNIGKFMWTREESNETVSASNAYTASVFATAIAAALALVV